MRFVTLLAALLGSLAVAASAQAHITIIEPPGATRPYQRWVDEAGVPTPDATIAVVEETAECAEALSCTDGFSTIWILPNEDRSGFFHEVGHDFNYAYLLAYPERQSEVLAILGHPRRAWDWAGSDVSTSTGSELFADAFSLCARVSRIDPRWPYSTGDTLTKGARLRSLCGYLRTFPD